MTEISTIDGCGGDDIRAYVLRNPDSLVYAEPRFLRLIAEHVDAHCSWLVAKQSHEIRGVLPYLVKEGPLGPVFNSLAYYGSNGGVIQVMPDTKVKSDLVKTFFCLAKDANAASATIISNPLDSDTAAYETYSDPSYRDFRIGQITHLPNSPDQLISTFADPRPRNIRRAVKEGVKVTKGGAESLEFLYQTHVENMKAIGGAAKTRAFFEAIPERLAIDDWAVFTATLNGAPIAAVLLFYFNNTVEYFTPVILERYRSTQSLTLTIYEAMIDAITRGFRKWNWGGTWASQGGVYDFKRRWGTSEYRYYYFTQLYKAELLSCRPADLLEQYAGFFLFPFNFLVTSER